MNHGGNKYFCCRKAILDRAMQHKALKRTSQKGAQTFLENSEPTSLFLLHIEQSKFPAHFCVMTGLDIVIIKFVLLLISLFILHLTNQIVTCRLLAESFRINQLPLQEGKEVFLNER